MARFLNEDDSICAVATPSGRGGIGVIRLSGPHCEDNLRPLCPFLDENLESHRVYYGFLSEGDLNIDEVLVTYFEEGRSFTGQKSFEISFHGNPVIGRKILRALASSGARLAEPGEFTYRAFMGGRIDLPQAEAVVSLIESRNEKAGDMALRQLKGHLSSQLIEIEDELTRALAHLEANIDFAAEDIVIASDSDLTKRLGGVLAKLNALVQSYQQGQLLKDGFRVALIGAPNVGKSSLLNRLMGEDRAIVTDVPGTTRDVLEGEILVDGYSVFVSDTAGLRETEDKVEKIGVARSLETLKDSHLIWWLTGDQKTNESIPDSVEAEVVRIQNKCDLGLRTDGAFNISAKTGEGIEDLLKDLKSRLAQVESEESMVICQSRQYESLLRVRDSLEKSISMLAVSTSPEFVIAELQEALFGIMEVLGKRFDDEVIDRVFQEFCLGK